MPWREQVGSRQARTSAMHGHGIPEPIRTGSAPAPLPIGAAGRVDGRVEGTRGSGERVGRPDQRLRGQRHRLELLGGRPCPGGLGTHLVAIQRQGACETPGTIHQLDFASICIIC